MRAEIAERWQGLDERVTAKLASVAHADRSPEKRFADLAVTAPTTGKRITWLRKAADHFAANLAPVSACRSGCAHCCHIGVAITHSARSPGVQSGVESADATGVLMGCLLLLDVLAQDVD